MPQRRMGRVECDIFDPYHYALASTVTGIAVIYNQRGTVLYTYLRSYTRNPLHLPLCYRQAAVYT